MAISRKDVEHVALLARLKLTESEVQLFTKQLSQILEHAGNISELDTSKVSPSSHALPVKNVFREDKVKESISKDAVLSGSPEQESGSIKVPKIV